MGPTGNAPVRRDGLRLGKGRAPAAGGPAEGCLPRVAEGTPHPVPRGEALFQGKRKERNQGGPGGVSSEGNADADASERPHSL